MNNSKPKILIVSSADPLKGPGVLASDYYNAYKQFGYEVDVLTTFKCELYPEFLYVCERYRVRKKIVVFFRYLANKISRALFLKKPRDNKHYFFYREEEKPPVEINKVLNQIKKQYDLVQIIFWQGLLSFATVQALYRRLNCLFYFSCVDYSPMSGGCHFIGDCERYKEGCGCCPAYESHDPFDFTWKNVNFRKKVYDEIDPIVTGNQYMFRFYDQSVLLKRRKRVQAYPIIDTTLFKPYPKEPIRWKLKISDKKKFILLFGCQGITDERKGIKYLIESVNKFSSRLTENERQQVLVMSIGKDFEKICPLFKGLDTLDLGYVSKEELPTLYSLADVFLCSSINDAGPMMVDQAICCGTPVVGFEMGACLDAVKDKGTGYCAKLKDTDDFADGIFSIYKLTDEQRQNISDNCVKLAQNTYSYKAAIEKIIGVYNQYKIKDY